MSRLPIHAALIGAVLWVASSAATGESVSDYAVRVSAVVQTNPPGITLSWPANAQATNCIRYRKTRDATSWGTGTSLAPNATNYVASSVSVGSAYEYRISRTAWTGTTNYSSEGYLYAGIAVPLVESRGKVILVVDNTQAASLALELTRLQQDLVGDGWTVLRHDVARMAVDPANTNSTVWAARSNELASVKALIKTDYNADQANVKAVFLFGHVPVPYSGKLNPDGHLNHFGAWPADVYYGEMTGTWTDSFVDTTTNSPSVSDPRNSNVPGDGKFDSYQLPSDVELPVGRVDLANLPAFPQSETELLRQYLDKDHNFRHQFVTAERRGLIDDHFGVMGGEAFAVNGWRNFAPFFGAINTVAGDWLPTLSTQSYLWGYGCGSGDYTTVTGVATTSQLVTNDPRVVFTMLFGSYLGDWDSRNNFLRAQLATPTYTLASAWAGRPHWMFHHMALGETIGFSTRVTQNNSATYAANIGLRWVHIALMGDPTLRLHPVAPPAALTVATNGAGGVRLSWNPSPDPVAGYHVYRAAKVAGSFTRLTGSLITATNYTDPLVSSNVYMVRAVKLEESASGTYYNPSQGVFQSLYSTLVAPAVTWPTPADIVYGTALGAAQLNASSPVPGTFAYSPPAGTVLNAGSSLPLSVTFTPTDTLSYMAVTTNVSLNVSNKALTITVGSTNKVYGAPLPGFTASYSGFVNGDATNNLTTQAVLSTTATAASLTGNYPITASGASSSNYTIGSVAGTLTVGKAALTITANGRSKSYGNAVTFAGTEFTTADLVNSDVVTSVTLTSAGAAGTATVSGSPYAIVPSAAVGTGLGNYAISYLNGTLTVLPAALTGLVTSSANPSLPGQSVSFTLALSAVAPGAGTPTGNVQFNVDGANAGAPVALSAGAASYSSSVLAHGTHTVRADYVGDENFTGTTNLLSPAQLINTPPVAGADLIERDPTTGVKVAVATLLTNDTDADGDLLAFLGASASSVNGGTVVSNGGWLSYTPAAGFTNTDTFTYTISDGFGVLVTGTVTVNVRFDNGPPPNLTITDLGGGAYAIRGEGIPDRTYQIEFADHPGNPNWQTLGTATADPSGVFAFLDTSGSPQRFYRSVYP